MCNHRPTLVLMSKPMAKQVLRINTMTKRSANGSLTVNQLASQLLIGAIKLPITPTSQRTRKKKIVIGKTTARPPNKVNKKNDFNRSINYSRFDNRVILLILTAVALSTLSTIDF